MRASEPLSHHQTTLLTASNGRRFVYVAATFFAAVELQIVIHDVSRGTFGGVADSLARWLSMFAITGLVAVLVVGAMLVVASGFVVLVFPRRIGASVLIGAQGVVAVAFLGVVGVPGRIVAAAGLSLALLAALVRYPTDDTNDITPS